MVTVTEFPLWLKVTVAAWGCAVFVFLGLGLCLLLAILNALSSYRRRSS